MFIREITENKAIEMKISDLTISDAGMAIAQSVGGGSRTDAPLAVTKLPSGHVYLVNGYHRLVDAMQAGKDTVSVKYVPYEKVEILWKQEREQDIKYGKQFNEESEIWQWNKEDPNNPEVYIQGYGRLMLNQIEDSIVGKLKELTKMAERGDFEQIQKLLDRDVLQLMMKSVVDTKAELQSTRKRGGPKSRGINKESIFDALADDMAEKFEAVKKSVTEYGVGKIVPGINTTVDVGPNEIKKQAAKFGNKVSKDGLPKKNLR